MLHFALLMIDFESTAGGDVCWEIAHCCCSDCVLIAKLPQTLDLAL